jgi:enoyl-CoA hydratase/carnithine racemase
MSLTDGRDARPAPDGFRIALGEDGIAVLTIDRPDKRNALTLGMWEALPELLADLAGVPGLRALLVTGAGETFSAGADIAELAQVYEEAARARAYHEANVAAEGAMAAFPMPTVAVVRGSCVGGGCQLAIACDVRLAADSARLGITPARLGIVYPSDPTLRLVRLVGVARAKYLLFTAELVSAARAYEFGLVDEVVPDADLDKRALEFAGTIVSRSPQTIGAVKAVIEAHLTGRDPDIELTPWQRATDDVREGLAAFLENRAPNFGEAG